MGQPISSNDRVRLESEIIKSPNSLANEKAYLCLRKINAAEDVIYFPVVIKDARISFGKIQFLIVPFSASNSGLGSRWVERKQLVLAHDYQFYYLEGSFFKDVSKYPLPRTDTRGFGSQKGRHDFFDLFFAEHPKIARLQRGFFRLGKPLANDIMYFPIQVENGRKSFGRPQYLIIPYGSIISAYSLFSEKSNVGHVWVDKKALTMEYHMKFEGLQAFFDPFSPEKLLFPDIEED
jgi:hypothetical protein